MIKVEGGQCVAMEGEEKKSTLGVPLCISYTFSAVFARRFALGGLLWDFL